jgi:cytoskeletal protein RodZ
VTLKGIARMAEQKSGGLDQQTMMYILIGVVVVLIAVVGFMFYQNSQPKAGIPAGGGVAQQAPQQAPATTGQGAAQAPAGMGQAPAAAAPVDPKASTKVTTTPKQWVNDYYAAAVKGDWTTAYKMLPAANRAQATEQQFGETQKGYGIKGFKVTDSTEQGNKATVTATLETASYGNFSNQWSFEKVGDAWYVAGKKTMMGGK